MGEGRQRRDCGGPGGGTAAQASITRTGWDAHSGSPEPTGSGPQEPDADQLEATRTKLRKAASEAADRGERVGVVSHTVRSPSRTARTRSCHRTADCDQLEWTQCCRNNLSSTSPGARAGRAGGRGRQGMRLEGVIGLVQEGQVKREDWWSSASVPRSLEKVRARRQVPRMLRETRIRCATCGTSKVSKRAVRIPGRAVDTPEARDQQLAYLVVAAEERWAYWQGQFERCLRCYACRAVCPLCYCDTCVADKHQPQWVPITIDDRGNTAWNTIRAHHLAGRCSGCDECARVCPADIRLDLLNRHLAREVERQYRSSGRIPRAPPPLTVFRTKTPGSSSCDGGFDGSVEADRARAQGVAETPPGRRQRRRAGRRRRVCAFRPVATEAAGLVKPPGTTRWSPKEYLFPRSEVLYPYYFTVKRPARRSAGE